MSGRIRPLVAVGAAATMSLTSCSDPKPMDQTPNPFIMDDWVLDNATSIVLADVVSIEPGNDDTETVTLRPIVAFVGDLDVADEGTLSFTRPADERDDTHRGFWLFDERGNPMSSTDEDEDELISFPWYQSGSQHDIFERYPFAVDARDILDAAPIVVLGEVPLGTLEAGDEVITLAVSAVLRGELDAPTPTEIEVEIRNVTITSAWGDDVWLLDRADDGSLVLYDTWIMAPWEWSMPALGDALREAFPDDAPATTP